MAFNFADVALLTLDHVTKKMGTAIGLANPVWKMLSAKGKRKEVRGGKQIKEQMEIAENSTVAFVDGRFDEITIQPEDILGEAPYDIRWVAGSFVFTEDDIATNAEPWQLKNLLTKRANNLMTTMKNKVSRALFTVSPGSKAFNSIPLMFPDDPTTGTFAGINRATANYVDTEGTTVYYWRSQYKTSVSSASTLNTAMLDLWTDCTIADETPDLIIMGKTHWKWFNNIQTKTIVTDDGNKGYKFDPGFKSLQYNGVPVIYDTSCPANRTYMINTKHMDLYIDPRYNFKVLEPKRAERQLAFSKIVVLRCCLTVSSMRHHGVITN